MQQRFLLQLLLLAQHVSATTMPIIRSSKSIIKVVAACGISCCKSVKNNFVSFCGICVLSLKCRVLSRFVTRCVECRGGRVWVFFVGLDNTRHLILRTQILPNLQITFYVFTAPNTTGSNTV